MDLFLKNIEDVPLIIWQWDNIKKISQLKCVKINKNANELFFKNNKIPNDEITLKSLNLVKYHKVKRIIKKNMCKESVYKTPVKNDCMNRVFTIKHVIKHRSSITLRLFKCDNNKICMFFEQNRKSIKDIIENINVGIGFLNIESTSIKIMLSNSQFEIIWNKLYKIDSFKNKIIDQQFSNFYYSVNDINYYINCHRNNDNTHILITIKVQSANLSQIKRYESLLNLINQKSDIELYDNIKIQLNSLYGLIDLISDFSWNDEQIEYITNIKETTTNTEDSIDNYYYSQLIRRRRLVIKDNYFDLREFMNVIVNYIKQNAPSTNPTYNIDYNIIPFLIGDIIKLKYIFKSFIILMSKFTKNNVEIYVKSNIRNTSGLEIDGMNTLKLSNIIFEIHIKKISKGKKLLKYLKFLSDKDLDSITFISGSANKYTSVNFSQNLLISKYFIKMMQGNINYSYQTNKSVVLMFNMVFKIYTTGIDISMQKYGNLFENRKILVLDDQKSNLNSRILMENLQDLNLKPIMCENKRKGRKYLLKQDFDVGIINLNIYKKLNFDNIKVPIIGITTDNSIEQSHANCYILKVSNINKIQLFNILVEIFSKKILDNISESSSSSEEKILENKGYKFDGKIHNRKRRIK